MTDQAQLTLNKILLNGSQIRREEIRRVIVLYNEREFAIGDSCIRLNYLRVIKSYYENAFVTINFTNRQYMKIYEGLLKNSPNINQISTSQWREIPLDSYDIVFFGGSNEQEFLLFMDEKYGEAIRSGQQVLSVFSFTQSIQHATQYYRKIFPDTKNIVEHERLCYPKARPTEIYLAQEERDWASQWLKSQGLHAGENLFIVVDATSVRSKMLKLDVFFEFLSSLLAREHSKVLIFDEMSIGKEAFYREWIGERNMKKMIFAKGLGFRNDLSIIGSGHTKLVFGPCTGMLHCSSAIFNYLINSGMSARDVPPIITYTGVYDGVRQTANVWWGSSPLVDCLMVKRRGTTKTMVQLKDLSYEEKNLNNSLPCSEFTAEMLIHFVNDRIPCLSPIG